MFPFILFRSNLIQKGLNKRFFVSIDKPKIFAVGKRTLFLNPWINDDSETDRETKLMNWNSLHVWKIGELTGCVKVNMVLFSCKKLSVQGSANVSLSTTSCFPTLYFVTEKHDPLEKFLGHSHLNQWVTLFF